MTAVSQKAVGAVVFDSVGRVLLVRRKYPPMKGAWTIPGGHVEPGESVEQAAEREVYEETGLRVQAGGFLETIMLEGDGYAYAIEEYLCALAGSAEDLHAADDADEVRWVALHDLDSMGVNARTQTLITKAYRLVG